LKQEAEIPSKIDRTKPLEAQARQAFELRNEARAGARESMSDRELADKLTREEPNMTWEQVQQKYSDRGLKGDDLWNAIIDGSQKSRASVNASLGVKPPGSQ
jgi:filamentous hemagglutinin